MSYKKIDLGGWQLWVERDGDIPKISAYKVEEGCRKEWVNTLQITSDGRIIGWSPAGGSVPAEVHRKALDIAYRMLGGVCDE